MTTLLSFRRTYYVISTHMLCHFDPLYCHLDRSMQRMRSGEISYNNPHGRDVSVSNTTCFSSRHDILFVISSEVEKSHPLVTLFLLCHPECNEGSHYCGASLQHYHPHNHTNHRCNNAMRDFLYQKLSIFHVKVFCKCHALHVYTQSAK